MSDDRAPQSVNAWNADYVEELYARWKEDADAVEPQWRQFFAGFELGLDRAPAAADASAANSLQGRVDSLIYHYRDIGHFAAALDPLGTTRPFPEGLTLESFELSDEHLDGTFDPGHLPLDNPTPLREIISLLEDTYCRSVGAEYMHIQDRERRRWLQRRMETVRNRPQLGREQRMNVLESLIKADGFESFLRTRYTGKKRFGLEGGESLITMLDEVVESGPANGVNEFALGMAHRGRLNVLANVLNKTFAQILTEFHESWTEDYVGGGGDVKYHQGYSCDHVTRGGQEVHLTLAANPSHLEFVTSVVLGRTRAKQRLHHDDRRDHVVPVIIHGDAALPGQGVTAECFNLMRLDGYTVGGTIHVVVNNQVGFTTNQIDSYSGHYCTDIAKMIDAPIFHVNGDDPEACAWVARMALEYRQAFNNDVVIDMWCYRLNGHNESDEPSFTQPLLYKLIRDQKPVVETYRDRLVASGDLTADEYDERYKAFQKRMDEAQVKSREEPVDPTVDPFRSIWSGHTGEHRFEMLETGVERTTIERVASALSTPPEGFDTHKTLKRVLKNRAKVAASADAPVDWATAELLAFGSLLAEGHAVRLTGQDVERGTFSQRHCVFVDQTTAQPYLPLNNLFDDPAEIGDADGPQARFCVHNSPLSEAACVGYEYGYSLADPEMLILWEAQFGDFANGAQVLIDQFIASAEKKWNRSSGIVLLLPHGYEGQGPEHSSARLERFLQLCADRNMQVCQPSTAAQHFHMLRRQIKQRFRKPLIVMTPKSMLRNEAAYSAASELESGHFRTVLDDVNVGDPRKVTTILLCSGKVRHVLDARRAEVDRDDVAIVCLEQLFPFDEDALRAILDRYPNAQSHVWVQEEPRNQGAFRFVEGEMFDRFELRVAYAGRRASASPAVGSLKMHEQEQEALLTDALGPLPADSDDAAGSKPAEGSTSGSSSKKKSAAKAAS